MAGLVAVGCTTTSGGGSASVSATPSAALPPPPPTGLPVARFEALPICQLTPSAFEGPFPNRQRLVRRDLTEGRPGHPVDLGLRVVDADCQAVVGAEVAVWHTDHTGDYSEYTDGGTGKDEAEGTTFLRGVQPTDPDGIARFTTIFPGWYDGRAVHLHVAVRTQTGAELITQLYFDEALTVRILSEGVYADQGPPDTSHAADGLAGDPASEGTMLVTEAADVEGRPGTLALLNLGLDA